MRTHGSGWIAIGAILLLAAGAMIRPALAQGDKPVATEAAGRDVAAPQPAGSLASGAPAVTAASPAAPVAAPQADKPSTAGVAAGLLPQDLSVSAMFRHADTVVQAVLVGLIVASIVTWTFLLGKGFSVLMARRSISRVVEQAEMERSLAALQLRLRGSPAGQVQRAMAEATAAEMQLSANHDAAGIKERVTSRLQRLEASAGRRMARGTGILATIGSTAPFIGLFGTVWGIMNSFIGISQSQTTNLAVVAPGIAEALLATATGLVAAIPAVVIYNVFARAIGGYRASLADLSAAILRLVSRELDRHGGLHSAAAE